MAFFAVGWAEFARGTIWDRASSFDSRPEHGASSMKSPSVITFGANPSASPFRTISGRAGVIDGDTIEIHGERIRLNGIDAPESAQLCQGEQDHRYRCGAEAARHLAEMLAVSRPTRCELVERDRYGRMVANCYRADGANVAALMVRTGYALDWPRYSQGRYAREQQHAREQKSGIWRGTFTVPWQWRARTIEDPATVSRAPSMLLQETHKQGSCRIKGNVSAKGERIYHMPGQRYYGRTKINTHKGERWFCSESEARAAGWRRSNI